MVTTLTKVEIERPAAEVFAFVTNPDNARLWQAGLLEVTGTPGMPAGSTGEIVMLVMGRQLKMKYEVLENDGREFSRSKSRQGPIQFETQQRVQRLRANRSRLVVETKIDAGHVFRLAESALEAIAIARMEADMAALKAVLEAQI